MRPMAALPEVITANMEEIRALCEKHGVKRLAVFGSAVKGTFDPDESDLDFVVEFFPVALIDRGRAQLAMIESLESMLGRPVDLVDLTFVRNPYFREELDETQRELYAA